MKFAHIKANMYVAVKHNAHKLTRASSCSWDRDNFSETGLKSYENRTGIVIDIDDNDKTIKLKFDIGNSRSESCWFDAIHLELPTLVNIDLPDEKTPTDKEIITQLKTELAFAQAELLKYKPKKFPDLIFGAELADAPSGLYREIFNDEIHGVGLFYVNKCRSEVFYVLNDDIEMFDYSAWCGNTFARVSSTLKITLS